VTQSTLSDWLAGKHDPMGNSLAKLRAFLHHEAKPSTSNEIRPIERVPMKIVTPRRELLYARLCPFCPKAPGKIRQLAS
jgi:hypothetical protein